MFYVAILYDIELKNSSSQLYWFASLKYYTYSYVHSISKNIIYMAAYKAMFDEWIVIYDVEHIVWVISDWLVVKAYEVSMPWIGI